MVFIFFATLAVLPPIIFKYRKYPHRSIFAFLILWITFPKYIRFLPFIGTYDFPGFSYFNVLQTIAVLHIIVLLISIFLVLDVDSFDI